MERSYAIALMDKTFNYYNWSRNFYDCSIFLLVHYGNEHGARITTSERLHWSVVKEQWFWILWRDLNLSEQQLDCVSQVHEMILCFRLYFFSSYFPQKGCIPIERLFLSMDKNHGCVQNARPCFLLKLVYWELNASL